jgi:segregation and condensation protein A
VPAETAVSVRLPIFEGPLDLLLHLIRVNEVNIYDIPIAEITRQYDQYLGLMQELNLQLAGDYLVMAATLVHIKSRMLLPQPPAGEEPAEDPRADLVRRLVEYETLKAASEALRDLAEAREAVFFRPGDPLEPYEGEALLAVSIFDLVTAFRSVLDGLASRAAVAVAREEFSIEEKQAWLLKAAGGGRAVAFQDLIASLSCRAEMVAAFLALLELIRLGRLRAAQLRPRGEILLMAAPGREGPAAGGGAGAGGEGASGE